MSFRNNAKKYFVIKIVMNISHIRVDWIILLGRFLGVSMFFSITGKE